MGGLGAINGISLMEDRVIENDVQFVSEWERIAAHVTGENIFIKDNQVLSVANVNRHAVEQTLGVDVVYYQHEYRSFVLVQYKKLRRGEDKILRYRPDTSFDIEIQKMVDFRQLLTHYDSQGKFRNAFLDEYIFA